MQILHAVTVVVTSSSTVSQPGFQKGGADYDEKLSRDLHLVVQDDATRLHGFWIQGGAVRFEKITW